MIGHRVRIKKDKPNGFYGTKGTVWTIVDETANDWVADTPSAPYLTKSREDEDWEEVKTFSPLEKDNNPKARAGALKVPTQFVPPVAKLHLGLAMKDGAVKYGPFNWRTEPVSASTYMGAMERHLAAWFDGEDLAEDSGCHHLAHVMACCALVLDSEELGILVDDRPPQGPSAAFLKTQLEKNIG